MKYLISPRLSPSIDARRQYIYDTMKLWTLVKPSDNIDGFTTLESLPSHEVDIFFIVGHNYEVKKYLQKHASEIKEANIVAITCDNSINLSSWAFPSKNIFIPFQTPDKYADLLDGNQLNFEFNPTKSELLFYIKKSDTDFCHKLTYCFTQVKRLGGNV